MYDVPKLSENIATFSDRFYVCIFSRLSVDIGNFHLSK